MGSAAPDGARLARRQRAVSRGPAIFRRSSRKTVPTATLHTSVYDITYEAECADFEWERMLELCCSSITKPLFLKEEFQAEFGNVREELTARANNHFRHLSLALRESYGFLAKTDQERLRLMKNVQSERHQGALRSYPYQFQHALRYWRQHHAEAPRSHR